MDTVDFADDVTLCLTYDVPDLKEMAQPQITKNKQKEIQDDWNKPETFNITLS